MSQYRAYFAPGYLDPEGTELVCGIVGPDFKVDWDKKDYETSDVGPNDNVHLDAYVYNGKFKNVVTTIASAFAVYGENNLLSPNSTSTVKTKSLKVESKCVARQGKCMWIPHSGDNDKDDGGPTKNMLVSAFVSHVGHYGSILTTNGSSIAAFTEPGSGHEFSIAAEARGIQGGYTYTVQGLTNGDMADAYAIDREYLCTCISD
jgi:hypothetical protein